MMLEESAVYEPQDDYTLYVTAKRYWREEFDADDPDALTLVFLHSTSFHKETWVPTIERVFDLVVRGGAVKIREAWAIDCPNHGASAQLNELALQQPEYFHNFTCEKYAIGAHHFLTAGPYNGARVDFRKRNLVGIGHSLGSVAMTILQHIEPILTFSSIMLVEPMLSPGGPEYLYPLRTMLVKSAYERRDVWPSRENALQNLRNRHRTAKWDPRILELFVKYALRPHPGSYSETSPYNGVTLACTRDQEAAMYRDVDGPTKPVLDLNRACERIPVHVIFGDITDFLTREVHEAVIDPNSSRWFASITRIEGCGHLVPQESPEKLGDVIFAKLNSNAGPNSKL